MKDKLTTKALCIALLTSCLFLSMHAVEVSILNSDSSVSLLAPVNDDFESRLDLTSDSIRQIGSNRNATSEVDEPPHAGQPPAHSVWWTWTAPANGTLKVQVIGTDFNPDLALYVGESLMALKRVQSGQAQIEDPRISQLEAPVSTGTPFHIVVDSMAEGDFELALDFIPEGGRRHRLIISEALLTLVGLIIEPEPEDDGLYIEGTRVMVNVAPLPGSYLAGTGNRTLEFLMEQDVDLVSEIARVFDPPLNDTFEDRIGISGDQTLLIGSNANTQFDLEEEEPDHVEMGRGFDERTSGARASHSVWWTWTAHETGTVTIEQLQGFEELVVTVYESDGYPVDTDLVASTVADRPVDLQSGGFFRTTVNHLRMSVEAGSTYQIAVASFIRPGEATPVSLGDYILGFDFLSLPPNDRFENRTAITDFTQPVEGHNIGSDPEPEPGELSLREDYGHSVWWSWTPTESHWITLVSSGSDFDSFIAVYKGSLDSLKPVAHADTSPPPNRALGSRVTFFAEEGVEYAIAVSGVQMFLDSRSGDRVHPESMGRIRLEAKSVAVREIGPIDSRVNADQSTSFNGVLQIHNFSSEITNPLRVRLIARRGYSQLEGLNFFADTQALDDQILGTFEVPAIRGSEDVHVEFSGRAPAPDESQLLSGTGWGVFAIVEEQFGNQWFKVDDAWLLYSVWPTVGTVSGPGGGVIRLNPGVREENRRIFDLLIVDENRVPITDLIRMEQGEIRTFTAVALFTPENQPFAQPVNTFNCPGDCDVWTLQNAEPFFQQSTQSDTFNVVAVIDTSTLEETLESDLVATLSFNGRIFEKSIPFQLIAKQRPTISWTPVHPISFGTPLGPEQLNATSDTDGTFTYEPGEQKVLPAGTHTLTVFFSPTDVDQYESITSSVRIEVTKVIPVYSRFVSIRLQDNQILFLVEGFEPGTWVLEKTQDFQSWDVFTPEDPPTSDETGNQVFSIPLNEQPQCFFRFRLIQ